MPPMTATFPELIVRAVMNDPGLHTLAEVVAVTCLVAVLLEREMVRHQGGVRSRAVVQSLTALALPLGIAWALIALERFLALARI